MAIENALLSWTRGAVFCSIVCGSTDAWAQRSDVSAQRAGDQGARRDQGDQGDQGDQAAHAAPPDPKKARDDAILLGTLLSGNAGYSVGSSLGGLAYCASGVVFAAASITYVARGGSFAPAIAPMTFGVGGLALGVYHLAQGNDLLALQIAFLRATQDNTMPEQLVDTFEPRLRDAAYRARGRRRAFGYGLIGFSFVTLAAAIYTTARPVTNLEGGTLPSVLYGAAAIDALGALTTLAYETPTEIAWLTYVRGTTLE